MRLFTRLYRRSILAHILANPFDTLSICLLDYLHDADLTHTGIDALATAWRVQGLVLFGQSVTMRHAMRHLLALDTTGRALARPLMAQRRSHMQNL